MRLERDKVNQWLSCALVLMMPFSWVNIAIGSVYRLVVIVIFGLYLINNRVKIQIAKESMPLFLAWTFYTAYALMTTLWAQGWNEGVNNAMGMLLLYITSLVFLSVVYDDQTKKIMEISWLIATIFLALLFLFGETIQLGYGERRSLIILGTPTDANEFASFFIIGISVIINLFLKTKQKWLKVLLAVVAIAVIYVVLMAASRGALLSMIVAATVTLFVGMKNVSVGKVIGFVLVGIVAVIVVGISVLPLIPQDNLERIMINSILEDAGSGRSSIWSSAWNSFINGDVWRMLIGYGYGRFDVVTEFGGADMMMHNQLLQQLISYGIVGLSLYIALVFRAWLEFRSRFREYYGVFIGIMVMSMTLTMGASYKILWTVLFMALMQNPDGEQTSRLSGAQRR